MTQREKWVARLVEALAEKAAAEAELRERSRVLRDRAKKLGEEVDELRARIEGTNEQPDLFDQRKATPADGDGVH